MREQGRELNDKEDPQAQKRPEKLEEIGKLEISNSIAIHLTQVLRQ